MNKALREYFSKIGAKGGKAGKRKLSKADARAMQIKSLENRRLNKAI